MRRPEHIIEDEDEFLSLLNRCEYGSLTLNDETYPYCVPVNFVYHKNSLIIHGASKGRKYELINKNPYASFSVVEALSFIPSFYQNSSFACPATQFFLSAYCEGKIIIEKDVSKKAKYLDILMKKFQEDNSYMNISQNIEKYKVQLEKTSILKFEINSWTMKAKLGQNMNEEKMAKLLENLQKKGNDSDLLTIKYIKKFIDKD